MFKRGCSPQWHLISGTQHFPGLNMHQFGREERSDSMLAMQWGAFFFGLAKQEMFHGFLLGIRNEIRNSLSSLHSK